MEREQNAGLETAFRAILPAGIAFAVEGLEPPLKEGDVFAAEAAAMARAVPKRRAEFFAGRSAAHRAMRALGHSPGPVTMGEDRAPVWPAGLVGSISHCSDTCVALVAEAARYRAVAVDIEPDADLPDDVIDTICLPSERMNLPKQGWGRMARLIFSAKETVYKLQYPISRKMLEFSDVEVVVDVVSGKFEARVSVPLGPDFSAQRFAGHFGRAEGKVFCVMFSL